MDTLPPEKENELYEEVRNPANFTIRTWSSFPKYVFVIYIISLIVSLLYHVLEVYIPLGLSFTIDPASPLLLHYTALTLIMDIIFILIAVLLKMNKLFLGLRPNANKYIYQINMQSLSKLKALADTTKRVDLTLDIAMYRDKVALQEIYFQRTKPLISNKVLLIASIGSLLIIMSMLYFLVLWGYMGPAFFLFGVISTVPALAAIKIPIAGPAWLLLLITIQLAMEIGLYNWNLRIFKRRTVLVHYIKDFLGPAYAYDKVVDPKDNDPDADDVKVNVRMVDYYASLKALRKLDAFKQHYMACPYCARNMALMDRVDLRVRNELKAAKTPDTKAAIEAKPKYDGLKLFYPIQQLEIFDKMEPASFSMNCLLDIIDQINAILVERHVSIDFIKQLKKKLMKVIYFSNRATRNEILKILRAKLKTIARRIFANQQGDIINDLMQYDKELSTQFKDLLGDGREIAYMGRI